MRASHLGLRSSDLGVRIWRPGRLAAKAAGCNGNGTVVCARWVAGGCRYRRACPRRDSPQLADSPTRQAADIGVQARKRSSLPSKNLHPLPPWLLPSPLPTWLLPSPVLPWLRPSPLLPLLPSLLTPQPHASPSAPTRSCYLAAATAVEVRHRKKNCI